MGAVFEELIRKFNEENNEEAGEHFTPRDIIKLMTHIIFEPVRDRLAKGAAYLIYDPACGSGGMLTEAENYAEEITAGENKFHLYGQEVNPETYAVCTSDMLIKGEAPGNILFGSTLSKDGFPDKEFDFMLSNPPYGKSWKIDMDDIFGEKKQITDHRFLKGVPRSSDGQLLFLSNMAAKMKHSTELGSRVASVHNGSALFTGDAGSGESEIRRWLIENDWLDCIIGLPKDMFYNTGISTYIFIVTNRKAAERKGKVQLIDASGMYEKMRRNLGKKSNSLSAGHIDEITRLYLEFKESEQSKIFKNDDFGFEKITVERPLRLAARFSSEGVAALRYIDLLREIMEWMYSRFGDSVYSDIGQHKNPIEHYLEKNEVKISPANKRKILDEKTWKKQARVMEAGQRLFVEIGEKEYKDFNIFRRVVDLALKKLGIKLDAAETIALT